MPATVIAGSSLCLSQRGWAKCGGSGEYRLFGIDRFGKINERPTEVVSSGSGAEIFVGTSRGCGNFVETTNLLSVDGERINVGEVVRSGSIAAKHFEHVASDSALQVADVDSLWEDLTKESACAHGQCVVIRCRSALSGNAPIGRMKQVGQRWYVALTKKDFESALNADPQRVFQQLFTCFTKDDAAEVLRDSTTLVAFFCASLDRRARPHVVKYDGIQHTSLVQVAIDELPRGLLADGRCAQQTGRAVSSLTIAWEDSSWRPLVNGLLVTP